MVSESIIGIDIFGNWQNPHIGSSLWDHYGVIMVGQAKWKLLEPPPPAKIVKQKQHCISKGNEDTDIPVEDLKEAGLVIPNPSHLTHQFGLCKSQV